jgi:hypothetical protein
MNLNWSWNFQISEIEADHSQTQTGKTNLLELKKRNFHFQHIRTKLVVPGWQQDEDWWVDV